MGVITSEINSSRSRQNSDASENYDDLLGGDNYCSMDNDDSQRILHTDRSDNNSVSLDDDTIDNLSGLNKFFSTGRSSLEVHRNKPSTVVLRSLGSAAKENITPQQLNILIRMRELLRSGVEVLKHGRGGRPKRRILYCESDFTKLFWRHVADGSR